MDAKNIILDIKDLVVSYKVDGTIIRAVNNISIQLEKGKTLGLVGETGAGKTTTALSIMNLIPNPPGVIENGEICINGRNILGLKNSEMSKIRGSEVSMIFQDPMSSLNPVFTVGEQIAESLEIHEKITHSQAMKKAGEMLELVGIPANRAKEYPHQFSGGMKQRVVIAIALTCNPQLLIADEPTTALDVTIQAQVLDLMRNLKEKYNTAMVMITHDLGIVAEVCDEVAVMYAGKVVEQGSIYDVFNKTLHPYTEGLFNSLPHINKRHEKLIPIPGLMPDPSNLPCGCSFAPRCQYADEFCKKNDPITRIIDNHMVRCNAYERDDFILKRREKQIGR